ncbi:MAG: ABC transporter ATP-binding protein C-terminal domain-containing protein, partial [Chloroflexota bacterium]
LIDEPSAGLTPAEVDDLAKHIRQVRAGGTAILLVEHNMPLVVGLSDRITVLDFGKLLADGTPAEVRGNPDVVRAYIGDDEPVPA